MNTRWRAEEVLGELKAGKLDEWDARRELSRIYGDCSCMDNSIRRSIRNIETGDDTWVESNRLEHSKRQCDLDD